MTRPTDKPLIEVEGLTRLYGPLRAVDDIGFTLHRGEVLGFLGPNGAGKSTTMQMLCGALAPSAGRILIDGVDLLENPLQAKQAVGFLPEQPPVYAELTVDEYLRYCARLRRVERTALAGAVDEAKQRCGLGGVGGRLIGNLSKGYRQRVGIAQAIVHSPPVVILDEPTVGLDPIQIREIRQLIRDIGHDHGVILSTHILPEVQMTCNRVQIIHGGRLVFNDSLDNLNRRMTGASLQIKLDNAPGAGELEAVDGVGRVEALADGRFRLHFEEESPAGAVVRLSVEKRWGLTELVPEARTLEQIFVELTSSEPEPGHDTTGEAAA